MNKTLVNFSFPAKRNPDGQVSIRPEKASLDIARSRETPNQNFNGDRVLRFLKINENQRESSIKLRETGYSTFVVTTPKVQ